MERYILTLKQKAAIKLIVLLWKRVDKRPSRVDNWYPSHVQMQSALKKMRKIINSSDLPTPLKKYLLNPVTDYDMLEKHAFDFYYDFDNHPSEYLEPFICELEKKACKPNKSNKKHHKAKK